MRDLHPATRGFALSSEAYDRGRPAYPRQAIDWVVAMCGLSEGRSVLDLGAGTGKLTSQLIPSRATVVALEPIAEMRVRLKAAAPMAAIFGGTAEAIAIRDGSFDAVTAAQAFHWFRTAEAAREIHRVLRPGGKLVPLWNVRDQADPLQADISAIIEPFRLSTPSHRDGAWKEPLDASGLFEGPELRSFEWLQRLDRRGLVDRVTSISYIAALPRAVKEGVASQVESVSERFTSCDLRYRTDVYVYDRST